MNVGGWVNGYAREVFTGHARRTIGILVVLTAIGAGSVALVGWAGEKVDARAAAAFQSTADKVDMHDETLVDHEARLRRLEDMRSDVKCIRARLERRPCE